MIVRGIDVSNNNGPINWSAVAQAGLSFVFCKATEGATYHDPTFARNYAGARSAGLLQGAYNFARPGSSSAIDEADAYVSVVMSAGGFELPPTLDMEDVGGLSNADLVAWCRAWASRVSQTCTLRPLLYASSSFIRAHGLAMLADTYDLWLANYATTPDLGGWPRGYVFWQTTQTGTVPGVHGNIDANVFNGSLDDLKKICGMEVDAVSGLPKDVSEHDWDASAVLFALKHQMMGTFADGTFRPNEPLTRGQAAVLAENIAKYIQTQKG